MPTTTTRAKAVPMLKNLRNELLELHTVLIRYQQKAHEKVSGRVPSKGHLFELIAYHPSFAWLRVLSELIVSIDVMLDETQTFQTAIIRDLRKYTRLLLTPSQKGNAFSRKYHHALQNDPMAGLAHARLMQLLKTTGE